MFNPTSAIDIIKIRPIKSKLIKNKRELIYFVICKNQKADSLWLVSGNQPELIWKNKTFFRCESKTISKLG